MPINKVVFDTNIYVGAQSKRLVQLVEGNDIVLYSSPVLLAELTDVLGRKKFARHLARFDEYLLLHQNLTEMRVTTPIFNQSPDPKDNYLFDLAIQSGCNLIVTGDKKLLAVSPLDGVRVISLATFWAEL